MCVYVPISYTFISRTSYPLFLFFIPCLTHTHTHLFLFSLVDQPPNILASWQTSLLLSSFVYHHHLRGIYLYHFFCFSTSSHQERDLSLLHSITDFSGLVLHLSFFFFSFSFLYTFSLVRKQSKDAPYNNINIATFGVGCRGRSS